VEWFEVVFEKLFVKKSPSVKAKGWCFVMKGQRIEVRKDKAKDEVGRLWAELSFRELSRTCEDVGQYKESSSRGFVLIDGTSLGLPQLLRGPLGWVEWPEEARERVVALTRLSGEEVLVAEVREGDIVETLQRRAAELLGHPLPLVKLAHAGRVLSAEEPAEELLGRAVDVIAVAPTPMAISGSEDGALRVWDLTTMECVGELAGHEGVVWCAAADFLAQRALSGSLDCTLRLWDIGRMACHGVLTGHSGAVVSLSADFPRQRAASGSDDGTVRIWNLAIMTCCGCLDVDHGAVWALDADFQELRAVSGSEDGAINVWDLGKMECIGMLAGHYNLVQSVVADFRDTRSAVSACDDGSCYLWDLDTMKWRRRLGSPTMGAVWALDTSLVMPLQAISGSWDGVLRLWDVEAEECCGRLVGRSVCAAAADFRARRAVTGAYDGSLHVVDLEAMVHIGSLEGHQSAVRALSVRFT